jgi:hypothetical protein
MSLLAASTVAALLIASPSASDADRLAANGGFLLGSAHRCGIAEDRVVQVGHLIRNLIRVAAEDARAEEDATVRFARFFLVSATQGVPQDGGADTAAASCRKVAKELDRLEHHRVFGAGGQAGFRRGDGG